MSDKLQRTGDYRAVISKNTTIVFDFIDLIDPLFSERELLIPWLKAGNKPDYFIGKTKTGERLYCGDIVKFSGADGYYNFDVTAVIVHDQENGIFELDAIKTDGFGLVFDFTENSTYGMTLLGNKYLNPELMKPEEPCNPRLENGRRNRKIEYFLISYASYSSPCYTPQITHSSWSTDLTMNKSEYLNINAFIDYIRETEGAGSVHIMNIMRLSKEEYYLIPGNQ